MSETNLTLASENALYVCKINVLKSFRNLVLIPTLFGVLAMAASAQTPTPKPTPEEDVIKVSSRLVVVPVSVTDDNGDPVVGLTATDFRVSEEGRRQSVESVGSADVVPLEIALLFDISASTDAMFRFEQETAARFLHDVMKTNDRATVFTVGERGVLVQPRDTSERSIASIRAITPTKEQTAFYDAVRFAAEHLRRNAPEGVRKVMVIISDGEDTNSEGVIRAIWNAERKITDDVQGEKLRDLRVKARDGAKLVEQARVVRSLQDADAVFYSINPAGSSFRLNKMSVFGQQNMERFAKETGGSAFLPSFLPIDTKDGYLNDNNSRKNQELLDRIFRQLANELRAQYLIQYYSEAEFPANRFVKVDIDVPGRPGSRVRSREGYFVKN